MTPLRTEAIDIMTELLQQSEWVLPQGRGGEVAAALRDRLVDKRAGDSVRLGVVRGGEALDLTMTLGDAR